MANKRQNITGQAMSQQNKKDIKPAQGLLSPGRVISQWIFGATLLGGVMSPALAAKVQAVAELRDYVSQFLSEQMANRSEQDIEISVGQVDRRLKLVACKQAPKAFLAPGAKMQGKLTVGLRCSGPKPWTVYIPAQIKIFTNVVAAAHPLFRGDKITAADLISVRQELSQLRRGYFTQNKEVVGKKITQNLVAGRALTPRGVKAPLLVHRGEKVTILASVGTLKVKVKGKALQDAAKGELVSVRNVRSKRIVQGIAIKPGVVSIQM
jgi:flagellar basal body P-ring formation protein FlgA